MSVSTEVWDQVCDVMASPVLDWHGVDQRLIAQARAVFDLSSQTSGHYAWQLAAVALNIACDACEAGGDKVICQLLAEHQIDDLLRRLSRMGGAA